MQQQQQQAAARADEDDAEDEEGRKQQQFVNGPPRYFVAFCFYLWAKTTAKHKCKISKQTKKQNEKY